MTGSVHERPAHDEPTDNMVLHAFAVRCWRLIREYLSIAHQFLLRLWHNDRVLRFIGWAVVVFVAFLWML